MSGAVREKMSAASAAVADVVTVPTSASADVWETTTSRLLLNACATRQ
jgi:hypothetical protein